MTRLALAVALVAATSHVAHADEPSPTTPQTDIARIRELYARGDYEGVRHELLLQYESSQDPALLFALGQVELNLGNYDAAIGYYEQFIASSPGDDQVALAQQAIGAARMKQKQQPDVVVEKPLPRRRWYVEDTGFVALGGAALLVGGGLLAYSYRLGSDRSGTLSDYDARVDFARTTRWTGIGVAAGGALVVGVALLRWRLRPDGGVTASAAITPNAAGFAVSGRW
ncbi:MAG: hypothetical protein HOV81_01590 [Kofleriaceae bacterium]|nr:hypothetical protein [Kofleriaceae bacterium]